MTVGRAPVGLVDLVSDDRRTRIRAIRNLPVAGAPGALAFALRRVLFGDADAVVRAAAARRLAAIAAATDAEAWLLDALGPSGDRSPLVRDAIIRGLATRGTGAACAELRRLARHDRVWWVRRAAIYALAAIAGAGELAAYEDALRDPFWRVRHAAVKVLVVLGARDPLVRQQMIDVPASSALTFLRASWGPIALEAPGRASATTSRLPTALLDPDPAVVTARLAADRDVAPVALVELLCDPHAPLRILAAERIAASGDGDAYRAALDWLEEPRIPHVADTVERMLDGLGDPAAVLAAYALGRGDRPGAARWAIGWVVATRFTALHDAVLDRARHDAALRDGALAIADDDELVRWAVPGALGDAIAAELHARDAHDALLALDPGRPRVRALQIDAHARRAAWPIVEAALADPHHGPRAVAAMWCARAQRGAAAALVRDPDPAVREAALTPATAPALIDDVDPFVARAAIDALVAAFRHDEQLPGPVAAAALRGLGSPDPWIRAQACRIGDAALAVVIERLGDPDDMVRAAAHDALERSTAIDERLTALLGTAALSPLGRAMSHAWLSRALDDAARDRAIAALDAEPEAGARVVLGAVAGIEIAPPRAAEAPPASLPPARATVAPVVERRRCGHAGFAIAPLVISGAFDLSPAALELAADAGVDGWFWEPSYDSLTAFLRTSGRDRSRVITGTYHADAAAIEADVHRALRRLRRDALDVFLLFWSRSPARVDAEAFAMLDKLKRAGKLRAAGFSTHDRALACTAIATSPWDVVMIRHSAAHPGIEAELLPAARARGTAIVTFSALCYGRMVSGPDAPSAADCYRYSLTQPGVVACISAPRRRRELIENLDVLRAQTLDDAGLARLRDHGIGVRAENQRFNRLMRQPTRDAAAAARDLLAAELPPGDEIDDRPLPRATVSRGARTSLGTTRRRR